MNKSTCLRTLLATSTVLVSGLLFVVPAHAQSLPDTGHVTVVTSGLSGGAPGSTNPTFNTTGAAGAQTLTVGLKDNRTILNWNGTGFNIAAGNTVYFTDTRAKNGVSGRTDNIAVLNRVPDTASSPGIFVYGALKSDPNVGVYLLSNSGVYFGSTATVNTGSLFAIAGNITNDRDFLSGSSTLRFSTNAAGAIGAEPGSSFKTTARASSDGGRVGDFVLMGSRIVFNGVNGSKAIANVSGDAALVVARDVTFVNAPGSPLSFTINAGSTFSDARAFVGGDITARNIFIATTAVPGTGSGVSQQIEGNLFAKGASVTDRGIVLSAGRATQGVDYASTPSNLAGSPIAAEGSVNVLGLLTSAKGISVATASGASFSNAVKAAGAFDAASTVSSSTTAAKITASSATFRDTVNILGKVTATAGDVTVTAPGRAIYFGGGVQASGGISVTADSFSEGASVGITTLPYDITAGGDININVANIASILGKIKGQSLSVHQTSGNGYVAFGGDISTRTGDIGMTVAGQLSSQKNMMSAGLLTLSGAKLVSVQSVSGTAVSLSSSAGIARAVTASASAGDVQMIGDSINLSNAIAPNGNISLTAVHGATLGGLFSNHYYSGGNSSAGGNVTIDGGTDATVRGNLTVGGDLLVSGSSSVEIGNVFNSGITSMVQARGAITLRALSGEVSVDDSTTVLGNSDGIGSEPITFDVNSEITLALAARNSKSAAIVLGGPNRQSDVQIRFRSLGYMFLGGLQARGLLSAFGSNAPFTSGFTTPGSVYFQGTSTFTDTLKINASSATIADNVTVTNGNIDVGTTANIFVRGSLMASGDISLRSNGGTGILLDTGVHLAAQNVVLSSAGAFNARGNDSIAASGHWVIYSASPGGDTFGGLNSGNTAIWGSTLATRDPSTISGNRYVFALQPTLTFSTQNLSKVYGTDLTGSDIPFTVTGYRPGVAGAFLGDTAATAWSGIPLLGSAGLAASASVAGGPYATTISGGSLTSDSGYNFAFNAGGKITITPGR